MGVWVSCELRDLLENHIHIILMVRGVSVGYVYPMNWCDSVPSDGVQSVSWLDSGDTGRYTVCV